MKKIAGVLIATMSASTQATNFSALEECAQKSISQLSGMSVLSASGSASRAQIVMSESAYGVVMKSEQTGGGLYDDLTTALSISKMCWAERDPSSRGIVIDIVTPSGMLIIQGR
jgi:hypothetical protein